MSLINVYLQYLADIKDKDKTKALAHELKLSGFTASFDALSFFIESEGWMKVNPYSLWGESACYVGMHPPSEAPAGALWFDPYDVSFMAKTTNPEGYGKGVVGWLSISPALTWQYLAFLKLKKTSVRREMFLDVDDLLEEREFGSKEDQILTDIYHEEAVCYSAWQGKWLASNLQVSAALKSLTALQKKLVLPQGMYLWDSAADNNESLRRVYGCSNLESRQVDEVGSIDSVYSSVVSEWARSPSIGLLTFVRDRDGIWPADFYPMEVGECLSLENCSRNI